MSETKRVELTTVSVSQKRKKAARKQVTYRFHVTLGESNIETCPEYSFTDFMRNDKPSNGDPFDDSDEEKEVTAIAQRFEAKYGPKGLQSGKKARTQEMDDYYDPGGGYDEDDPFIDNTEAYDEVVPSSMTTLHGGFYINQGKLSLKNLNDDLNDFVQVKKKKKNRRLDSENEEETGASLAKKFKSMKRKKQAENREGENKKVSFSKDENGEGNIKKKIKLKLKKMLPNAASQKDRISSSLPEPVLKVPVTDSVTASSQNKVTMAAAATTNGTTEARTDTSGKDELGTLEDVFSAVLRDSVNEDSSSKSGEEGKGENQTAERNTQLPPQLPPELLEAIENMKREAKESKEKKLKFFTDHINKLLLDIEIGSHKLPWGSKTAIYNHLGEHLPCGKHTLQRRAKKLRESQEEDQLKEPIHKLREAIMKVMPGLIEQHDLDVQKAKLDAETKEEAGDAVKEEMSTESEGEEKSDNRKKPKGPRRKFLWNSELRDLLMSIVATKMKHYSTSKSRNQTAEEYLKAYLDSEIKSIWPQGWMQTRMLFKESKKVHEDMTRGALLHNRQKKAVTGHDVTPSIPEIPRVHVSKVEDVIEISSMMETSNESKDTVVVNLPNSVTSLSEVYPASLSSLMPSPVALLNKPSFKTNATTGQSNQNLSSVSLSASQKGHELTASLAVKHVNTDSASAVPKVLSAERSVPTKPLASIIYPVTTAGSRVTGSSSIAPTKSMLSNSSRSFLEVFDGFLNSRSGKPDISSTSSDQQSSQKQKFSILQHKIIPQQQQQQQPKSPQGAQNMANSEQYKAASKPRLVNESIDIPNLLRNKFPVMLSSKSSNSVASASHNLETQNIVEGLNNAKTLLQQNQILSYQNSQPVRKTNFVPKPHELVGQKQQQIAESDFPRISVADSGNQFANQIGIKSVDFNALSSEQKLKNRGKEHLQGVQNTSNQPNSKLKLGQVMDSSTSTQKMNVKNPVIRTGTVLSTGTLPQFTARAASDFTGWKSARGPESVSMRQPLLQGNTVSSTNNIVRPLTLLSPSLPPPLSTKLPGPLISSTTAQVGVPQSSNQSSLKSSEENSLRSAYEQMKSQMRQQEEIEGKALKNLAMALQSSSKLFEGPS